MSVSDFFGIGLVQAAASASLPFAARLTTPAGISVDDGSYSVSFRLYTVPTGGSSIWSETQTVTVTRGEFSAYLGAVTPLTSVNLNQAPLYLAFKVGTDAEMTPRYEIGSVPSAITANNLDGRPSSAFFQKDQNETVTGAANFTGGLSVQPSSLSGTAVLVNTNSSYSGNLIGLQVGGVDKFHVTEGGAVTAAGGLTVANGGASITGATSIIGNTTVTGSLNVTNAISLANGLTVTSGGATITGNSSVTGNLAISGTLTAGALNLAGQYTNTFVPTDPNAAWAVAAQGAPLATANGSLQAIGNGGFNGSTVGHFSGSSAGTLLGINAASGFSGNLIDAQVAGSPKFTASSSGAVTTASTLTVLSGGISVSSGGFSVTGNSTITGTLSGLTGLTVASGGASIAGGLTVTGAASISGGLNNNNGGITNAGAIAGATTGSFSGNVSVGGTLSVTGAINGATISGGTLSGGSVSGGSLTSSGVNGLSVASGVITSGTWQGTAVDVAYGGTGAGTFTSKGVIYGNGTGALQVTAAGTSGQLLVANASGVPTFVSLSGDATLASNGALTLGTSGVTANTYGSATQVPVITIDAKGRVTSASNTTISGVTPGGSAGGDLSGSYPNPTVARINGVSLGTTTATAGNLLVGAGSSWVSQSLSGDATLAADGTLSVTTGAITSAKIANGTIVAADLAAGDFSSVVTSGTYSIDISGNAGTVTNGVYTTAANTIIAQANGSVPLSLKPVASTGTGHVLDIYNNAASPAITSYFGADGIFYGSGAGIASGTIANSSLANNSITINNGTGISGGGTVALGGSLTITNAGVTSISGTANQVNVSGSTGSVTVSLPQDIHSGAAPTFAGETLSGAPAGSATAALLGLGGSISGGAIGGTYIGVNAPSSGAGSAADFVNLQGNGSSKFKVDKDGNLTIAGSFTGTVGDSNLSSNVALLNRSGQTFSGSNVFSAAGTALSVTNNASIGGTLAVTGTINGLTVSSGTISSGTWNGTAIAPQYGGTGINTSAASGVPSISSGTWSVSSSLAATLGGTGQTGFTTGDVLYASSTTALSKLSIGSDGLCLISQSGIPAWGSCATGATADTLQQVYDAGNTLTTTNARNFAVTLADTTTDANFLINIAASSTGKFAVQSAGTDVLRVTSSGTSILSGGLAVTGDSTITGTLSGLTGLTVASGGASISGGLNLNGDGITNAGAIAGATTGDFSGNVTIGGSVNGATISGGTLSGGTFSGGSVSGGSLSGTAVNGLSVAAGVVSSGTWQGGTIGVQYGGTGATTFTSKGVVYGNGTGALQVTAAGTSGQLLVANATGVPTFVSVSGDATLADTGALTLATSGVTANTYGSATQVPVITIDAKGRITSSSNTTISGVAPGGTAGGDLSGSYPNPTVAKINGALLGTTTATDGNLLIADGSQWASQALSGDASITNAGLLTVSNNAITSAKIANGTIVAADLAAGDFSSVITSGTYSVSISGNAGTVTNGVYTNVANVLTAPSNSAVPLSIKPVASTGTGHLLDLYDNGATPAVASYFAADGIFHGSGAGLAAGSVANSALANNSITINNGTGISGGGTVALGSSLTITNAGVTSLTGTANQVSVSGATGGVTISLPQSIATSSNVTFNDLSLGGNLSATGTINGLSAASGIVTSGTWHGSAVDVAYGGTGAATFTSKGLLYGNGTGALQVTAAGTDGQLLVASATGVPTFVTLGGDAALANDGTLTLGTSGVTAATYGDGTHVAQVTVDAKGRVTGASNVTITGAAPTGSAGGDLSGNFPNPTVAKINGVGLGTTTATAGNLLIGSGSQWVSQSLSGDATLASNGTLTVANDAITSAKIANGTITASDLAAGDFSSAITSGTYSISISGNAGTVTNGVYTNAANTITSPSDAAIPLSLKPVATTGTGHVLDIYNNAASPAITSYFAADGIFHGSGAGIASGTIANGSLANNTVTVTAGTGLSGGGSVALGSSITITNAGVTSLAGTTNQVNVSGATGAVTISLPQSIATSSNVTFNDLTLGGNLAATGTINGLSVASGIISTGTWQGTAVDVAYGGTGAATFTSKGVLYGNGTGALQVTAAGTSGQLLVANGSGVPTFVSVSGDATLAASGALTLGASGVTANTYGSATQVPVIAIDAKGRITSASNTTISGVTPGGTASGDLSGTYPGPTVAKINGATLGTTTASDGNILIGDGSQWATQALSGDASLTNAGVLTVTTGAITSAKIANGTIVAADLAAGDFSSAITSGTYSVNISGNAGTVTNGVYTNAANILTAPSDAAVPLSIKPVASTGTGHILDLYNNASTPAITSYFGADGLFHGSGAGISSGTIANSALANNSITINNGTGISGGGTVALGGSLTITNAGVTSLTGTSNQVAVSGSTGAVTLSLPQDIHTGATPTFASQTLSATGGNALALTGAPAASGTSSLLQLGSAIASGASNGTYVGVNSGSGFTGNFIDLQKNGSSKFSVDSSGNTSIAGNLSATGGVFYGNSINVTGGLVSTAGGNFYSGAATANNGIVNIGPAATAFDGSTSGYFAGSASGTQLAINAGSSFTGNLLDLQLAGSSRFSVDASGNVATHGDITLNNGNISSIRTLSGSNSTATTGTVLDFSDTGLTSGTYLSLVQSASSYSGTGLLMNFANGSGAFTGNFVDFQVNGSSKFKVDASGSATVAGTLSATGSINTGSVYKIGGSTFLQAVSTNNEFLGFSSGNGSLTGYNNTTLGYNTGSSLTSGYSNSLFGANAGAALIGGGLNVYAGDSAGISSTSANANVGVGSNSLYGLISGTGNVAIGTQAAQSVTTGNYNVAIGFDALQNSATNVHDLIAIGNGAQSSATGIHNIGIGGSALIQAGGQYNIGLGLNVAPNLTSGSNNLVIGGYQTGNTLSTGSSNVLLGYGADVGSGTLSNAIAIGYSATVGASNSLVLGGTGGNQVKVGIGTTTPVGNFQVALAPAGNANYGSVNIGSGAFDGSTSGFFNGSANGTQLAVNSASGFIGDFLNLQNNGISRLKVNFQGDISNASSINVGGFSSAGSTVKSSAYVAVQSGAATGTYVGFQGTASTGTGTFAGTIDIVGLQGVATLNTSPASGPTVNSAIAVKGVQTTAGNGTGSVSALLSNSYAFYGAGADAQSGSGTIANAYGLYLESNAGTGVTNHYGIVQAGTTDTNILLGPTTLAKTGAAALKVTGAPAASGTDSLIQIGSAIASGSSSGTFIGLNAANGYLGDLANLQVNGSSKFKVDKGGYLTLGGGATLNDDLIGGGHVAYNFGSYQGGWNLTTGNYFDFTGQNVTSGNVLSLEQDTSTFTGNGIVMNFANSSGSFSGNFVDFKLNGTSKFKVDASGNLTVNSCTGCGGAGSSIAKNANDTSSASYLGTLLGLTNSNTGAAGVLSLTNAGTSSALSITQSGNPTSGQALILANNTNGTPSGNLIDLQVGGTSKFSVDASGALTSSGSGTFSSANTTLTVASTGSGNNAQLLLTPNGAGSAIVASGLAGAPLLFQSAGGGTIMKLDTTNSTVGIGTGTTSAVGKLDVVGAPNAGANYGLVNIGSAATAFDGSTAGHFVGSGSGTQVAVDAASGFSGNLLDMQVAGSSKFKVDANGALSIGGTQVCTSSGCTAAAASGSYIQNGTSQQTSANFNIDGNGTIGGKLAVNSTVTTGTGANAGLNVVANSLTTGNGAELSSSSLTSGNVLKVVTTSTAGTASGTSTGVYIDRSGANANASHTNYGIQGSVTNTGTTSTNIAAYFTASGATNNYSLITGSGNVGLGVTPTAGYKLEVGGNTRIDVGGSNTVDFGQVFGAYAAMGFNGMGNSTFAIGGNGTNTYLNTPTSGSFIFYNGGTDTIATLNGNATSQTLTFGTSATISAGGTAKTLTLNSTTTGAITVDSGTTGAVNLGTGNNAKTINIGTGTAGNAINIGTNNSVADTIAIGSALDTVTISGNTVGINTLSVSSGGNISSAGTYNGQTISSAASLTGTLAVAGAATFSSTVNGFTLTSGSTIANSSGAISLQATSGVFNLNKSGVNNSIVIYGSGGTNNVSLSHDNTNGILASSAGELQLTGTGTNQFVIGDVGTAVNLVFEESSTISGQGTNTITVGQSGDTFNLNTSGVTYNIGTLTATNGVLNTSSTSSTALVVNGPTSLSSNLLDLQVNGSSKYSVSAAGVATSTGLTSTGTNTFSQSGANALALSGAPAASASSSLLQLGSAIASGSSSGTFIGINAANAYGGNLMDLQVNGSSKLSVSSAGLVTSVGITSSGVGTFSVTGGNAVAITGAPQGSATSSLLRLGSAIASGSSSGTFIGVNAANAYAGNLVDLQVNGATKFKVDASGNVLLAGTQVCTSSGCTASTGSASYIQNTSSVQSSSNFNISGNGTVGGVLTMNTVVSSNSSTTTGKVSDYTATGITSGSLLSLVQSTSTFTGTGIIMDFASGSGSFSGNFVNFKLNGSSKFSVDASGNAVLAGSVTTSSVVSASGLTFTSGANGNIAITPNGSGKITLNTSGNASSAVIIGDGGTTNYAKFDNNGALSFAGAARPYAEMTLLPTDAVLPGSNGCALSSSTTGSDGTNPVVYKTLDCTTTNKDAFFQFKMPTNYASGSNVQVDVYWISTATSGAATFDVGYAARGNGADFDGAAISNVAGGSTSTNASAKYVNTSTVTLTSPSINADDLVNLRLRNSANTLSANASVVRVRVRYLSGS